MIVWDSASSVRRVGRWSDRYDNSAHVVANAVRTRITGKITRGALLIADGDAFALGNRGKSNPKLNYEVKMTTQVASQKELKRKGYL